MMRWFTIAALAVMTWSIAPFSARGDFAYELDSRREVALIVAGAAAGAASLVVEHNQTPLDERRLLALDPEGVPRLDRVATRHWSPGAGRASDILVYGLLLSPLALMATSEGRKEPSTILAMYGETVLLNSAVGQLVKGLTRRTRPYAYNEDARIPVEKKLNVDAVRSFPSGHAANAFAAAVLLGEVHGRLRPNSGGRPWVWALSLSAAATTSALRVLSGKHYPSDVLVGAAIGAAIGALVPRLHEIEGTSGDSADQLMFTLRIGF